MEAHVVVHELFQPRYDELGCGLSFGHIFQLEVVPQPDGKTREQRHDDPSAYQGLGNFKITQQRDIGVNGIQDLCAVQFHLFLFTPFVTGLHRRRLSRGGVIFHSDVHRLLRGCERLVLPGYLEIIDRNSGEQQR